jgi:hypothetical protein
MLKQDASYPQLTIAETIRHIHRLTQLATGIAGMAMSFDPAFGDVRKAELTLAIAGALVYLDLDELFGPEAHSSACAGFAHHAVAAVAAARGEAM